MIVLMPLGTREHTLAVDEPPTLGGDDTAINPVEAYLGALLSCQVVTYRFYADKLGITIDELKLSAEGDLDVRGFFGLDAPAYHHHPLVRGEDGEKLAKSRNAPALATLRAAGATSVGCANNHAPIWPARRWRPRPCAAPTVSARP